MSKSAKNDQMKQMTSLDEKHQEMLDKFNSNISEHIPRLKSEIEELRSNIKSMNKSQIDQILDYKDEIREKKQEIRHLEKEKKQYLLDNSTFIFDYFESKKQISSGEPAQNIKVLNTFFKVKSTKTDNVNPDKYTQSKKMYQEYWRNVNNEFTNPQDYILSCDTCGLCEKGEMVPQDEEGIMICNNHKCGQFITYIVDSSKPNNKDPPNEVSYTAYIRLNHFKEILSQFQAKETTQIPDEVIDQIRAPRAPATKATRRHLRRATYDTPGRYTEAQEGEPVRCAHRGRRDIAK